MLGGEIMDAAAARSAVIGPSSISGKKKKKEREKIMAFCLIAKREKRRKTQAGREKAKEGSLWF